MASSTRHQAAAIGQSVGQAAAQTRDAISEAVEHGKEQAGELYGRASETMGQWKDQGAHQIRVIRGTVRRNALTSTLIAFGLGFILARLFFRRT